jgi:signal transduction histidine kinase
LKKAKSTERELVREQASRDYHDELGHKLTRISLYSRRIKKKMENDPNQLVDDLNNIIETSNSLQSGAKDLIWALNPGEDTLYDAAVRLKDFGNELFENSGVKFCMNYDANTFRNVKLSMNTKRHFTYIFKEGMNNILKYADCNNVFFDMNVEGNILEAVLRDDGIGFVPDNRSKGYGLKNIASRAKQISAGLEINSTRGSGTIIKLRLNI